MVDATGYTDVVAELWTGWIWERKRVWRTGDFPEHEHRASERAAGWPSFRESDPSTWHWANIPPGYVWRVVGDDDSGEFHLMSPGGRDLSESLDSFWDGIPTQETEGKAGE